MPRWHLYIASPMVNGEKPGQAYPTLYASLSKIPSSSVQLSEIKLVNDANPIARDAVMLRLQYPEMMPTKFPGKCLGDLSIEEAYVYPLPSKKEVTIYGLVYKGEPPRGLHLSLEPQNPNSRLVVESMGQRHEYPADTSMTWVVSVPEESTLERDRYGRLLLAWDLRWYAESSTTRMRCGVLRGMAYMVFDLCVGQPEPEIPASLHLPCKAHDVVEMPQQNERTRRSMTPSPLLSTIYKSGRRDLNPRPLDPQSSALAKLRYAPNRQPSFGVRSADCGRAIVNDCHRLSIQALAGSERCMIQNYSII